MGIVYFPEQRARRLRNTSQVSPYSYVTRCSAVRLGLGSVKTRGESENGTVQTYIYPWIDEMG